MNIWGRGGSPLPFFCRNRTNLTGAVPGPDDSLADRRPETVKTPTPLDSKPIDPATHARIVAPQRRAPKKEEPKQGREKAEVQHSGDCETGSHISLDLWDLASRRHKPCDEREDDPVKKSLDGRCHKNAGDAQSFQPGDQPRTNQRTDAERDENTHTIAGENRTEEPNARDRLQIKKII